MIQTNWHFENLLINFAFAALFFAMICYWIYIALFFKNTFRNLGMISTTFANVSIFILLVLRWASSSHLPLSNLKPSYMKIIDIF